MDGLFVIDTVGFITYFNDFFAEESKLSPKTRNIIDNCFDTTNIYCRLSIPSIVFIEIFEKFLRGEEMVKRFRFQIFNAIVTNPKIEIKSIDKEVIEVFASINDNFRKLEYHDKVILSSAMQLNCPLITNDSQIVEYLKKSRYPLQLIF